MSPEAERSFKMTLGSILAAAFVLTVFFLIIVAAMDKP